MAADCQRSGSTTNSARTPSPAPGRCAFGLRVERHEIPPTHYSDCRLVRVAAVDGDDHWDPFAAVERQQDLFGPHDAYEAAH